MLTTYLSLQERQRLHLPKESIEAKWEKSDCRRYKQILFIVINSDHKKSWEFGTNVLNWNFIWRLDTLKGGWESLHPRVYISNFQGTVYVFVFIQDRAVMVIRTVYPRRLRQIFWRTNKWYPHWHSPISAVKSHKAWPMRPLQWQKYRINVGRRLKMTFNH